MRYQWTLVIAMMMNLSCGDHTPEESNTAPDSSGADQQGQVSAIELDFDWRNIFEGQFWRIHQGQLEAEVHQMLALPQDAVVLCMQNFGEIFHKWSTEYSIRIIQLFATAMTESGCQQVSSSSDGLSAGVMQVTGRTCNNLLRINDPSRVYTSDEACRIAMADSADLSVELAAMYIADDFQTNQTKASDASPLHLDPIKVAAGYNAGSLKESESNEWHLLVTGNHLDRYANAYYSFVANQDEISAISLDRTAPHHRTEALPLSVEDRHHLDTWSSKARQGDAIFVGNRDNGHFYFFFANHWLRSDSL